MKKAKLLWISIISLFVIMEIYHLIKGHYGDILLNLGIVLGALLIIGVYSKIKNKTNEK